MWQPSPVTLNAPEPIQVGLVWRPAPTNSKQSRTVTLAVTPAPNKLMDTLVGELQRQGQYIRHAHWREGFIHLQLTLPETGNAQEREYLISTAASVIANLRPGAAHTLQEVHEYHLAEPCLLPDGSHWRPNILSVGDRTPIAFVATAAGDIRFTSSVNIIGRVFKGNEVILVAQTDQYLVELVMAPQPSLLRLTRW